MTTQKKSSLFSGRPVWAEVSLSSLSYNLHAIRAFVNPESEGRKPPRKILSIVKGNGYGHGGPEVAKALEEAGSDWFGVTSAGEGEAVRKAGVRKPILALTSFWPGEEDQLLKNRISPAIIRCDQLAALETAAARRKAGKRSVGIQLKVDTGMNRLGIAPTDIDCFARQYEKSQRLKLEGVFTHFASSEVFEGPAASQTAEQEESFHRAVARLRSLGIDPGLIHLANSAAIATRPETWADMVRPGAILYGYHPGYDPIERRAEAERQLTLRPVMSLRTRIISIRNVSAGTSVGYNATWRANSPRRIATAAIGYADGLHRTLSNRGRAFFDGRPIPLVGRVSMDLTTFDVTEAPGVVPGVWLEVIGPAQTPDDLAAAAGTNGYEVLTSLGRRFHRIYQSA